MRDEMGGSKRKTGKKRAPAKAKRCKHETVSITWTPDGKEFSRRCSTTFGCGAQLSLGESDEAPVATEIRAAELADTMPRNIGDMEAAGWCARSVDAVGVLHDPRWLAGWLGLEIYEVTHEGSDATAWPWDPTRPVADQQAEISLASLRAWAKDNMKTMEEFEADRALDDLDSTDSDAPTLASTTPLLAIATAGVGRYDIDDPASVNPLSGATNARVDEIGAEYLKESMHPDDLDPPTDPATKFGERAAQMKVTITLGPPEDLETMLDGEPLVDGIYTERQIADAIAAEDAMRDPAVTARNAAVIAEQTRHDVAASVVRHDDIETGGEG